MTSPKDSPQAIFTLIQSGNLKLAEKKCKKAMKRGAAKPDYLHLLGLIGLQQSDYKKAETWVRESLRLNPKNPTALNTLSLALKGRQRFDQALTCLSEALALNSELLDPALNRVDLLVDLKRYDEARIESISLRDKHPDSQMLLYKMAKIEQLVGSNETARELLELLLENDPGNIDYLLELSLVLSNLGMMEAAKSLLVSSETDSHTIDSRIQGNIALICERTNDLASAEKYAKIALSIDPLNPLANLTLAKVLRRNKFPEQAITYLDLKSMTVSNPSHSAAIEFERGRVNDELGRYDVAFESYCRGNAIVEQNRMASEEVNWADFATQSTRYPDQEKLQEFAHDDVTPVFMLGFPRSGTTLLHTMLAQHERIIVKDEEPMMHNTITLLKEKLGNEEYPGNLKDIDQSLVDELATYYWEQLGRQDKSTIVIDKMPLNTLHIPLILKMFRHPKFIFSLRHPNDVCLSAFIQFFQLSKPMIEFLGFESTVAFYDCVMDMWLKFQSTYELDYCVVKYEDLLLNREAELARLTTFLDIDWDNSLVDEERRTKNQGFISTASYHQVSRTIYKDSMFRWKNYGKYFEPYEPILGKYVKEFGYADGE